jgi:hypothetical protein
MDESTAGPFSRMASQLAAPLDRIESDRRWCEGVHRCMHGPILLAWLIGRNRCVRSLKRQLKFSTQISL